MLYILLVLSFFLVLFSIVPIKFEKIKFFWLYFFGFIFFLLAAFRPEGIDMDFLMYKFLFIYFKNTGNEMVEPTFYVISKVTKFFTSDYRYLFLVYAGLSVFIKLFAIRKISSFYFLSLLIWLCNSFILHDMTQIRASVGAALMLVSIIPLVNKNRKGFFITAFFAVLFHFSSLIILPFVLLKTDKFNHKIWLSLIPVAYIITFLGFSPFDFYRIIPIQTVQAKIQAYILFQEMDAKDVVNIFSLLIFLKILIILFFSFNIKKIYGHNRFAIICLKIYIISLFLLISFSKVIAVSLRLSELVGIVEIVLIPMLIFGFKPKYKLVPVLFVIFYGFLLFYLHIRSETLNF